MKNDNYLIITIFWRVNKLVNRQIEYQVCIFWSQFYQAGLRDCMLNRSASLAMSTCVLKALPGKLDIKRHSPSILFVLHSSPNFILLTCSIPFVSINYTFNQSGSWLDDFIRSRLNWICSVFKKGYMCTSWFNMTPSMTRIKIYHAFTPKNFKKKFYKEFVCRSILTLRMLGNFVCVFVVYRFIWKYFFQSNLTWILSASLFVKGFIWEGSPCNWKLSPLLTPFFTYMRVWMGYND